MFDLKEILKAYQLESRQTPTLSFLEIVNKSYNEVMISKILAYLIKTDHDIVKHILKQTHNEDIEVTSLDVYREKNILRGRIDLFVEFYDRDAKQYTLTIENKIYSFEHTDQTQRYYDFVEATYSRARNFYILLKPDYNPTQCVCSDFKVLNYSELVKCIPTTANYIICDFKNHIVKNFTKGYQMKESTLLALQNLEQLKDIYNEATKYVSTLKEELADVVFTNYSQYMNKHVDGYNDSYRLYKRDWTDNKSYLFYAEFIIINNGLHNRQIAVYGTIERLAKKRFDNEIDHFISNHYQHQSKKQHCVFKEEYFNTTTPIATVLWKEELFDFVLQNIKKTLEAVAEEFQKFKVNYDVSS